MIPGTNPLIIRTATFVSKKSRKMITRLDKRTRRRWAISTTRRHHIDGRPTQGCYERVLIFTGCWHRWYSWNYYRSIPRQSTPLRRAELRPSATKKIMKHVTTSCKTIGHHLHDVSEWIDSDIWGGEGWKQFRFPTFLSNSSWKLMIWRWLQAEDGTQILMYDRIWPMLGFGGQFVYMRWGWKPLIVVFGQRYHSIRTHWQVKANLLLSPQLLLCFSLYLQRIQPPRLAAIQSSHGLVYTHSGYRYHFCGHQGLIRRKALGIRVFEMVRVLGWNHPTLEMLMIRGTEHWTAAVADIPAHIWYETTQIW